MTRSVCSTSQYGQVKVSRLSFMVEGVKGRKRLRVTGRDGPGQGGVPHRGKLLEAARIRAVL